MLYTGLDLHESFSYITTMNDKGEILGHTTLEMVNHYLHFTSSQITALHHKYSPMDRMQERERGVESS